MLANTRKGSSRCPCPQEGAQGLSGLYKQANPNPREEPACQFRTTTHEYEDPSPHDSLNLTTSKTCTARHVSEPHGGNDEAINHGAQHDALRVTPMGIQPALRGALHCFQGSQILNYECDQVLSNVESLRMSF